MTGHYQQNYHMITQWSSSYSPSLWHARGPHFEMPHVCECSDLTVINGSCNPYAVVSLSYGKSRNKEVKRTAVKKKTICPHVCECSDLTVINGSCNPYAVVSLSYGKSRNKEVKRTAVKKKTICPQFDEKFFFYLDKSHSQDKTTNYAFDDFMAGELRDPNTLFRGNSLLTKMVDELMKLMGIPYLSDTLKTFIDQVVMEAKPCEIDPSRLKDGEDITSNLSTLYGYVSECINSITNSGLVCPSVMRDVFSTLKARAMLNYPGCHFRGIEAPILLKEGFLIKRAQGRKKFGLKNFKKRFFRLTNQSLSYSKTKGEKYLFEIPINDILVVERLAESSFKMKYMFQVVHAQTALYIQASNCVEEKQWLDILMKICKSNKNRLKVYHPEAFVNGHWLCCKSMEQTATGCTPVTGGLPLADIQTDIDSDREVEKIHSLFLTEIDKLDALQDACGSQAVYTGEPQEPTPWQPDLAAGGLSPNPPIPPVSPTHSSNCQGSPVSVTSSTFNPISGEGVLMLGSSIEDPGTCYTTLAEIQRCVITLEQEHIQYMRSVQRRTVIGSIDTPIGDESSADLVRNIYRSSERLSRHGSRSSNASNVSYRSYRGSRSRGGSFRERDRSGGGGRKGKGQAEGVRKSLSGDVSSSGRNLGVEFKAEVKKAASYDVMSCDIGDNVSPVGGMNSSTDDNLSTENKRPVFVVGRKDTESFSSSRTESSGGHQSMSISSSTGAREATRTRSSSGKPERGDSNAEQDEVFLADSSTSNVDSSKQDQYTSSRTASSGTVYSNRLVSTATDSFVPHTQRPLPLSDVPVHQTFEKDVLQQNEAASNVTFSKSSVAKGRDIIMSEDKESQNNFSSVDSKVKVECTVTKANDIIIKNVPATSTSTGFVQDISSSEGTHSLSSSDRVLFSNLQSHVKQRGEFPHSSTARSVFNSPDVNTTEQPVLASPCESHFSMSNQRDHDRSSGINQRDRGKQGPPELTSIPTKSGWDGNGGPSPSHKLTGDTTRIQDCPPPPHKKFHIFSRDPSQDDYFDESFRGEQNTHEVFHPQGEDKTQGVQDTDSVSAAGQRLPIVTAQQASELKELKESSPDCVQSSSANVNSGLTQELIAIAEKVEAEDTTDPDTAYHSNSKSSYSVSGSQNQEVKPALLCSLNGQLDLRESRLHQRSNTQSPPTSCSSSSSSSPSSPPRAPPQSPLVLLPQPHLKFENQQFLSLSLPSSSSASAPTPSLVLQPPTPHDCSETSDGDPTSPADPSSVDIQYV
ncbi:Ras family protein [Elysia marginata]|uniref:Ras family protein n=1 Tax=Elysia marginata TaxID=1093978 RepID=A0AAV4IE80_9GAST|nr:Ras family protein [Elysia marginata]